MMAKVLDQKDQAMWLAQGYLQGQRDLLLRVLEHRFSTDVPASVMANLAAAPADAIENLGPLILSAPTVDDLVEATNLLSKHA